MIIAVAGGTGWVGRLVVEAVRAAGDTPIVLARSTGVDLTTGKGLSEALSGASVVIDVSNVSTIRRKKSVAFFEAATTHLLAAEQQAGVTHHIALSIVGCDRVDFGYYYGKRRQEELVLAGPVPATVLRATQFHEFAAQILERGGPFAVTPKMLCQPIAAREVAAALVDIAHGAPAGLAPDLAGPREEQMADMMRRLLRARGGRGRVLAVRMPGRVGASLAGGGLLPASDDHGPRGRQTYEQWLESDATKVRPQQSR